MRIGTVLPFTMTLGDIATKVRALTHTDTSTYTDALMLIEINVWYQKVADMIFESQDDSDFDDQRNTNYPVQTTPMVANQRDYTMPVSENMLKIKRVDLTYDGTNWYRATPFDTGTFPYGIGFNSSSAVDPNFDSNFIKQTPRFDVAYNSMWVMPMPVTADVSAGGKIRVEWFRGVTPFTTADYTSVLTDSTVKPGFDSPFHAVLAYGAAYEFAVANNLPQIAIIQQTLVDWENRIRAAYGKKDLDMNIYLAMGYNDAYGR